MKITVEFDSIEQATAAVNASYGFVAPQPPAPAIPQQHWTPPAPVAPVAPAPVYAPAPPVAAPAPMAPPAPPVAAPAPGPAGAVPAAQLIAAAQAFSKKHGGAATKAVLVRFGVKAVGEINPAHHQQFLQEVAV